MIYITRREQFNAAHRLFREEWSDDKNREVFGKCSNPNWHGHNYELFVTVNGDINPDTGYLIDLKHLKEIIRVYVINKLDHKNVNLDVDFMQGKMASTEVLATEIYRQLEVPLREQGVNLHKIQLFETENNYAEYYGD